MTNAIYHKIYQARQTGKKLLAVLIDPDKPGEDILPRIIDEINNNAADLIFVGGSLLLRNELDNCLQSIRDRTEIPTILFPGSAMQISPSADAILFLSLISGRNPDLLIGTQVIAAPYVKQARLEVLPTGYMLIDCGKTTTAGYMSNTLPIPYHKSDIAACTAMAGEMLGLKFIYMDGGSGADKPVSTEMIQAVRNAVDLPIIVGGGIRTAEEADKIARAGADVVVIGNATEKDPQVLRSISAVIHQEKLHHENFGRNIDVSP